VAILLGLLEREPEGSKILSNVRNVHPMIKSHPKRLPKVPSQQQLQYRYSCSSVSSSYSIGTAAAQSAAATV